MSALAELVGPETAEQYAAQLVRQFEHDSDVIFHVKRVWGKRLNARYVYELRKRVCAPARGDNRKDLNYRDADRLDIARDNQWQQAAINGNRDFLRALAEGRR